MVLVALVIRTGKGEPCFLPEATCEATHEPYLPEVKSEAICQS